MVFICTFTYLRICKFVLFFGFLQDCVDLNDEAYKHNDGCKGNSTERKNIRIENFRVFTAPATHQDETKKDAADADEHPHIVFPAESKIINRF